jgi:CheY-like chemotaxis protein
VNKARATQPGIVLADINLGEGGSGIDAVSEILTTFDIPVIFITAYPERLLTGERPEPTYLITKPFQTVQATIGQALFFHSLRREAA